MTAIDNKNIQDVGFNPSNGIINNIEATLIKCKMDMVLSTPT